MIVECEKCDDMRCHGMNDVCNVCDEMYEI